MLINLEHHYIGTYYKMMFGQGFIFHEVKNRCSIVDKLLFGFVSTGFDSGSWKKN